MGRIKGRWSDLPWNDEYESYLQRVVKDTYKYERTELVHEIHKQVIEAHWVNLKLYYALRRRVFIAIALNLLTLMIVLGKLA